MTISQPRSLVLGLSLVLAACGGEGLTLPPDGAAANIEVLSGDGQSARVGEPLPDSVVVKVTDTQDRSVAGANVVFEFTANGSAANPATATTNADGIAWSRLVLGTIPGPVTGTAKVPVAAGVTPVEAAITATAFSDNANGIALLSGSDQTGPVGTELPAPLVVVVTDAFANPISGVTVEWSVTGGGSVSTATTVTADNGQASVTRTLGPAAGAQATVATANLAGSPVTFNHTATAGNAARVIVVDGNGQSAPAGTKLDKELVVQLLDEQNNPIPGRPVSWVVGTGAGSASPETSTTDGNGQAKTEWTLGPIPGPNTLTAVVSGVGNAAFNATGTRLVSETRITSRQPEQSIVGAPVTVGVSVGAARGTPTGQVTVTGDGAVAPCTITLANGSGSCQIIFAQPGNRDITATYAGDTGFSGSSDTERHQVNPVPNAAPVAQGESYQVEEDAILSIPAPGVLANDTDPEGAPLTAIKVTDPAQGTLTLNTNGSFTYTPAANYFGSDAFTYRANDGSASSAAVTVSITVNPVNDAPSFTDAGNQSSSLITGQNTVAGWASSISPGAPNEIDEGLAFDVTVSNPAIFSSVPTVSVNGDLTYTPATEGQSDVTVTLRDDNGGTSVVHPFTITVTP